MNPPTSYSNSWRTHLLFSLSIVAIFWLQPRLPITGLNWILPTLSLALVTMTWWIVRPATAIQWHSTVPVLVIAVSAGLIYKSPAHLPSFYHLLIMGVLAGGAVISAGRLAETDLASRKRLAAVLIGCLILLLVLLKTPILADFLSQYFSEVANLKITRPNVIEWLGFSYISFRLMAMLLDFRQDRLPELSFIETVIYVLFPPSLLAGPIDRAQRFVPDLRAAHSLDADRFIRGGQRIASGLVRKFILADSLALVALSPAIAADTHSIAGAWLLAYLYAFQIFFDFSGYSDMAIGVGIWLGIDLPENFNRPYLQQNLSLFWQNWHITLTSWFRAYFFLPFTRSLLRRKLSISTFLMAQMATMTLIGLWHGVQFHFVLWGLWHALGLYAHHVLARITKPWYLRAREQRWIARFIYVSGVLATFHFVVIGWVFFVLPSPFGFLGRMFGL